MKRNLLDITRQINRNPQRVVLTPKNLKDSNYFIWEAIGWKFVDVLRELQFREIQDRIYIYINSQTISANDCIIEMGPNGLLFKFIKSNFEFKLDEFDFIEVNGDIEKYA